MESSAEITIRGLYMLFGKDLDAALKLAEAKVDKAEILERTGSIVALSDINLNIERGTIFSIIGLSGSGKSTLIRNINRLIDPIAGQIIIQGVDVMKLSLPELNKFRQDKVSMVFQNFGLLPHWSIQDNIAFGLLIKGVKKSDAYDQIAIWLERVGLTSYAKKYPDELSGGMQQRVGLARAFAVNTDIILMDEPFSALDPIIRTRMQELLNEWQIEFKKTIVFITHDLHEAFKLGSKVAILKGGMVEQMGVAADLIENPVSKYVERFVKSGVLAR